jgi:hypothetical protein
MLADVLKTQGRTITPDPEPEKGAFYRSDHISLAKVGVPMLDPGGGFDLIEGGTAAGQAAARRLSHAPLSPAVGRVESRTGTCRDRAGPRRALHLGDELANSDKWPNWYKGNEFRAIRDKAGNDDRHSGS